MFQLPHGHVHLTTQQRLAKPLILTEHYHWHRCEMLVAMVTSMWPPYQNHMERLEKIKIAKNQEFGQSMGLFHKKYWLFTYNPRMFYLV